MVMINSKASSLTDAGKTSKGMRRHRAYTHLPALLKDALPDSMMSGLRQLKAMMITRGVSRAERFKQSCEDALAATSMSIVVPIHDAPIVLRRCLTSLEKYAQQAEVVLVDDASRMAETRFIIDEFIRRNRWRTIRNESAVGHSKACQIGAELSIRPFLCLLNSDTVVTPWCWRLIREAFEREPAVGVAGPSTSNAGNGQTLPEASRCLAYWTDNQICNFAGSLVSSPEELVNIDLPWISGFAFFIRRPLWERLRGFDENLPDYGNEVELCSRVSRNGYRMVWVRRAYIHHLGTQSYRQIIGDDGINARISAADIYREKINSTS